MHVSVRSNCSGKQCKLCWGETVTELPPALAALAAYHQFMCYVLIPSKTKPGKTDKLPMSPLTGEVVSAHDSTHWVDAATACATATAWGSRYGVAFVFTANDPFWFIDIDDHFDGTTWSPLSQQIVGMFPGAAMEISQSGRGMHIFGCGIVPDHGCDNAAMRLGFYTQERFVALTGLSTSGDAGTDHTVAITQFATVLFPPKSGSHSGAFILTDTPDPDWIGPTDDDDLIRRALASRSVASTFGQRASFADLWNNDTERLRLSYPDPTRLYNASDADAALVGHLAFWTGRHGARIERLMRRSGLVREKWDREDYLPRTICEILARGGEVLKDKLPEPPNVGLPSAGAPLQHEVTGNTFMNAEAQRALFAGCVYVQDRHRVLVPGGHLLKPDQFRVAYGGYVFTMDDSNKRTSRNAWEAFTESQQLKPPVADSITFRPSMEPGAILNVAGRTYANTWAPAVVARKVGDVSPFQDLMGKLFPDERDRMIFMSYMAACVQHQGSKFNWCTVLQGIEGNGKTLLSWCVSEAIGQHYTHWPEARDLASQFNGYLVNKTFLAVEELRVQEHQEEVIRKLYTIIAGGAAIQIQFKGVDQVSMPIVCNVMATTNFQTAIRKTPDNSRRFAIFFSPQQCIGDLARCGMDGDYFPRLWDWLKNRGGFAIVSELLHTFPIPDEFNPATKLHRAPTTSTTAQAVYESRGGIEQSIQEAIDQGLPGFMGGWVSSVAVDRLLEEQHTAGKIPHTKRRQMLTDLGYVLHPGLPEGRTNNPVLPDGRKPQLFVRPGSDQARLTGPAEIARAYSAAQTLGIGQRI